MALFRVDFSGRGELSERQQKVCLNFCYSQTSNLIVPIACSDVVKVDEAVGGI